MASSAGPSVVAMPLSSTAHLVGSLTQRARRWPEEAQLQARRNAMVAATALAQRRAEREEVAEFLAALHRGSDHPVEPRSAHA